MEKWCFIIGDKICVRGAGIVSSKRRGEIEIVLETMRLLLSMRIRVVEIVLDIMRLCC